MKNLINILGLTVLVTMAISSCTDNDDADFVTDIPSASDFENLKDNALESRVQEFSFNAEDGWITLTSDNGVNLSINGDCLTLDGSPVTGQIDIDYVEIFDKGSMLTTNKPTMGTLPGGDKALLISGGEFMIEATQNGELLEINCDMTLIVPSDLTGGTDGDMTLWVGTIDEDDNLTWDEEENANGQGGVFGEGNQYYAFVGDFGWTNIDRFYNDPRPKTTILAQAPDGYDNTNAAIYLSYDGEDSGLAALDTYGNGLFSEHYGQIPIGLECHAIFVTEENGNWRYSIKAVTIAENDIIAFTMDETAIATEAELIALINGLP